MIRAIYNKLKKKDEDLVLALPYGLALGLVFGLLTLSEPILAVVSAFGLALGLVFALTYGLLYGLAVVSAFGLALGLALGLANLSSLIPINPLSIILLIAGIIILAEYLFSFNKREKNPSWSRVALLKLDSVFSSLIIIINLLNLNWLIFKGLPILIEKIVEHKVEIITAIGYLGIGLVCLAVLSGIIYLWLRWNKRRLKK